MGIIIIKLIKFVKTKMGCLRRDQGRNESILDNNQDGCEKLLINTL